MMLVADALMASRQVLACSFLALTSSPSRSVRPLERFTEPCRVNGGSAGQLALVQKPLLTGWQSLFFLDSRCCLELRHRNKDLRMSSLATADAVAGVKRGRIPV